MKVTVHYLPSVKLYNIRNHATGERMRASRLILRDPARLSAAHWTGDLESADFDFLPYTSAFKHTGRCNPGYAIAAVTHDPEGEPMDGNPPDGVDMAYFRNATRRRGPRVHTFNTLTMTAAESARATH